MKKTILMLVTLFSLLIFATNCNTPKVLGKEDSRLTDVAVFVNQKPLAGISVLAFDQVQVTNDQGVCRFFIKKGEFKKDYPVKLHSGLFEIDTSFLIRFTEPTKIYLYKSRDPVEMIRDAIPENMTELDEIDTGIQLAQQMVASIQEALDQYLLDNSESSLQHFKDAVSSRQSELTSLKTEIGNLREEYRSLLESTSELEIMGYTELIERQMRIEEAFGSFMALLTETEEALSKNIRARPDADKLEADIFFSLGAFELNTLSEEQLQYLSKFVDRIRKLLDQSLSDYAPEEIWFELKVWGYTDGVPVGDSLWNQIDSLCAGRCDPGDRNNCLSLLRAEEIYRHLAQFFEPIPVHANIRGQGSIEAGDDNTPNYRLRRCDISFVVIPNRVKQ